MSETLSRSFLDIDVETGVDNGRLLAYLAAHGEVLSKRYSDERVVVHCRVPRKSLAHLHGADVMIRPHAQTPTAIGGNGYHQMGWDWRGLETDPLAEQNGSVGPAPRRRGSDVQGLLGPPDLRLHRPRGAAADRVSNERGRPRLTLPKEAL